MRYHNTWGIWPFAMLVAVVLITCAPQAQADQTHKLGDLTLAVPDGWERAPASEEKEVKAWVFGYVKGMKPDQPQPVVVSISFDSVPCKSSAERTKYLQTFADSVRKANPKGVKADTMQVAGVEAQRLRFDTSDGGTTFHVSPYSSSKVYLVTVLLPWANGTFPQAAVKLLDGLKLPAGAASSGQRKSGNPLDVLKGEIDKAAKDIKDILKGETPTKDTNDKPVDGPIDKPTGVKIDNQDSVKEERPTAVKSDAYICVSKDWSEKAVGLGAGDRVWVPAENEVKIEGSGPALRIAPALDLNRLAALQYCGGVSTAMEGLRELMGPLSDGEEEQLNAKWAPLYHLPSPDATAYFEKLNPLISELLSIRAASATASTEFDGAWEEAAIAASYESEEGVREALDMASAQNCVLQSLQSRIAQVSQAVVKLGNPPDPVQRAKQARQSHEQAVKMARELTPSLTISPEEFTGRIGAVVTFTPRGRNLPAGTKLNWTFGDGGKDSDDTTSPVKHKFGKAGDYTVKATAVRSGQTVVQARASVSIAKEQGYWVQVKHTKKEGREKPGEGPLMMGYGVHTQSTTKEVKFEAREGLLTGTRIGEERLVYGDKPAETWKYDARGRISWTPLPKIIPVGYAYTSNTVCEASTNGKGFIARSLLALHGTPFSVTADVEHGKGPGKVDQVKHTFTGPAGYTGENKMLFHIRAFVPGGQVEFEIEYTYKDQLSLEEKAILAGKEPEKDAQAASTAGQAQRETIEFHEANVRIIEQNLARDQADLAKETNPDRRAALQLRVIQQQSDLQAEKDLIASVETGRIVHNRTPFDDYARDQFIANIKQNQQKMEEFQRAVASLDRLAGVLPPDQADEARKYAHELVDRDVMARMDFEQVRKIAGEIHAKAQSYWTAEGKKQTEKAEFADSCLKTAETIKKGADAGMMVCSIFGGKGVMIAYQGVTGYVEGGPTEAVLRTASWLSTPTYIAAEAFRGYTAVDEKGNPKGWMGAAKTAGTAFITAKAWEFGVGQFGKWARGGKPAPGPTVAQQKELAQFQQARKKGESLVNDFAKAQAELQAAGRAGASPDKISKLQATLMDRAAEIHSNPHAKNFLKYKGDFGTQRAYNAHMGANHAATEAKFHDLMAQKGWNKQKLREFRNASSAGSVGMDHDIGLDELAGSSLLRNGKPASTYQWQRDAQQAWNQAYKDVTKRDALKSWETVTTSGHAESYKDLAWISSDPKGKAQSLWGQQAGDVTRYKTWHTLNDPTLSRMEKLQEISRGAAKDINTKLRPLLDRAKPKPGAAESLHNARAHWQKIQDTLDSFGRNNMDPISAERKIRELTGGKSIPDVVDDMATVLEGLIKTGAAK